MFELRNFIEQAKLSDIDEIHMIFIDVTAWLISLGVKQWDFSYPNKAIIEEDIRSGSCLVIRIDHQIVATVTLNQVQDAQYKKVNWRAAEEGIWVIHRISVNPAFQNKGIATQLCQYLEEMVLSKQGKAIRLDAFSENPYSNRMYLKLGYTAMNEYLYFQGNKVPFYAYEKILKESHFNDVDNID